MLDRPWSGTDYLNVVSGPVDRFPPLRVLFLAHRVAATGLITLVNIYGARGIWVQNGVIAGLAGFPDLLSGLGLKGEPGEDAIAMVTRGITSGQSPDRVITALSDGVAAAIAGFADLRGADVRFRLDARPPPQLLPPLDPFPRLLSRGLRLLRPPERLRPLFGPRLNLVAIQSIPDDAPESRWALDPTALRVLREAGRAPTLGELLGSGAPSGATWLAVDLLLQLGLLELVTAAARPVDKTAEKPVDRAGDRSVDRSVDRALDRSIDRSVSRSVAPPRALDRSVDRSVSRNLAAPQDRSVDASVSGRSAPRSARPAAVIALREALAGMISADEATLLGLQRSAELTEAGIDRAFRDQSVRFHPDRHQMGTPEQRDLAARCFGLMSDAYAVLRDPAARADRQARMKAKEEGRIYVSEHEQRAARLAYARAEVLVRQRRWADALPDLDDATRLDPASWRYRLTRAQAGAFSGRAGPSETEEALRAVAADAPPGEARAEVHFVLGELMMRDNREKPAMACFEEALKEHPEHAGAKRRMWLQKRRSDEVPAAAPAAGLFSGLRNLGKKP